MLPGIVAIDVPPETPVEWVEAATEACSSALGEGRCVRGSVALGVTWRAHVLLAAPTPPALRIELRDAVDDSIESTRVLEFRDIDPELERWASAGVVVAALVSAREAEGDVAPAEPEPTLEPKVEPIQPPQYTEELGDHPDPPPPPPPPVDPTPYPDAGRLWLDAALLAQSGAAGDRPALGGRFAGGVRPLDSPWLVAVRGSGAWVSKPFDGRWVSIGVGSGLRLATEPVWDVLLVFRGEQLRAGLTRTKEGAIERDQGERLRYGPGLESNLAGPLAGPLWAFVGAEAALYSKEIPVSSEGRLVGRAAAFSFGMDVGVRWILWH
jgi:hypothetical protein